MKQEIFCYPEKDIALRYLLCKKGKKNLLVIGLHPGTGDAETPDSSTRHIQQIAEHNGYDGWLLMNLYPQKMSNPSLLPERPRAEWISENWNLITAVLSEKGFNIKDVWLAWGDKVIPHPFPCFRRLILQLSKRLKRHKLNFLSIGLSINGNPLHPSQQSLNCYTGLVEDVKFRSFDFEFYLRNFRYDLNRVPDMQVEEPL